MSLLSVEVLQSIEINLQSPFSVMYNESQKETRNRLFLVKFLTKFLMGLTFVRGLKTKKVSIDLMRVVSKFDHSSLIIEFGGETDRMIFPLQSSGTLWFSVTEATLQD